MSAIFGANQSPRVTTNYLNDVNDPAPGVPLTSPSGSIVQTYAGQVGGKLTLGEREANSLSDPAIGTLHQGVYQYVQYDSAATAAAARGALVFWTNRANKTVSSDVTAVKTGKLAGVLINVIGKGNYGFIQIAGLASCLWKSAITKSVPADGDLAIVDQTPAADCDTLADATTLTSPTGKAIVGVAEGAATGGAISTVALTFNANVY